MRKVPFHRNNAIGIAGAALEMSDEWLAKALMAAADAGDEAARRFVRGLVEGAREPFLREIAALLKDYRQVSKPALKRGKFAWYTFVEPPQLPGKDWAYALVAARLVNAGLVSSFHECAADDCETMFLADPRARWCSKTCGSRQRVSELRRRRRDEQ